jgi:hypothetical protein
LSSLSSAFLSSGAARVGSAGDGAGPAASASAANASRALSTGAEIGISAGVLVLVIAAILIGVKLRMSTHSNVAEAPATTVSFEADEIACTYENAVEWEGYEDRDLYRE